MVPPDTPSPTQLADAAHAASRLRDAIRRSGLLDLWPGVTLDQNTATIDLGTVDPRAADEITTLLTRTPHPTAPSQDPQ